MSSQFIPVLFITANVGSIFEEPNVMLKLWTDEFLSTIARLDPKFIALHCQEVGGKNYEQSMRHVQDFVRLLISSEELRLFDKVRVFLDEDFSSAEHFTALGNLYFIHETLKDVLLWDFKDSSFVPVTGKEIHSGNIESVRTKEKAKFPQDFFPECKWSRKGFLRTRWNVEGTVFDLINIHLFHDASNLIAMESFPSVYSKTRRRALEHTLDRIHNDSYTNVPFFLFGDFNFRTDTCGVIKKLTAETYETSQSNKGTVSKMQFRNDNADLVLTLGKKEFSHRDHQQVFVEDSGKWLLEYDNELKDFKDRLFEFPINFVPSYPFQENVQEATSYMKTRVPAWCDRVLLSQTARLLVKDINLPDAVNYGIIGQNTCMGDHKPVYLKAQIIPDSGTITCCGPGRPAVYDLCLPLSGVRRIWPIEKPNPNLLSANHPKPEPYTPDSMDSPSPGATQTGFMEPALLKSRLEQLDQEQNQTDDSENVAKNAEDLGWQRSQVLTIAWLQGETTKGYRSFCGGPRPGGLLVPRIAIVDASSLDSAGRVKTVLTESIRSQELTSFGKKLKTCGKVTERCKKNLVAKKDRCEKCCVVS